MIHITQPIISVQEVRSVIKVLKSGNLKQGTVVESFEKAFATYCGVKYAVAVSSGTAALYLSLLAHDIGVRDEVITTAFSFIATSNAVIFTGAKPVFADIDPATFNLDPIDVERKITKHTKAVITVHLFGNPSGLDKLSDLCDKNKLILIEDACQAHGAEVKIIQSSNLPADKAGNPITQWKKVGSIGDVGCFSFYPTKNMTSAEGGMVTTNYKNIAQKIQLLRNHGMHKRYQYKELGFNFRMTDVHAAIGLAQLKKLDYFNSRRIQNASFLTKNLSDLVKCPYVGKNVLHVFHQYTIKIPQKRNLLQRALKKDGIETVVYYPAPLYSYQPYRALGYGVQLLPKTESICRKVLSLPIHPSLTKKDLIRICISVKTFMKRHYGIKR